MNPNILYMQNSYMQTACAKVLTCAHAAGGYAIRLDSTLFFPNKGGQPCDLGSIGSARVLSVDESSEDIIHLTDAPLPIGAEVDLLLDWPRRHDIMQQHGGEHLLSACAWHLYDTHSVGFHCSESYATFDLNIPVTPAQIREIETMANAIAAENRPIRAREYASEADIEGLPIRKQSEGITLPLRLVEIENHDLCTCCAPHLVHTGEIGQLKIISAQTLRGGTRLSFLCGQRALAHAQALQDITGALARKYSTDWRSLPEVIEKQIAELSAIKHELHAARAALDTYIASELAGQATAGKIKICIAAVQAMDGKRLRALTNRVSETIKTKSLCLLFSEHQGALQYALCQNNTGADAGELLQPVNIAVGGKGGGRGPLAQGSAGKCPSALPEIIAQLTSYFTARLK
ncbi:MAG: alanyl-tRNA editing protein [Clostridiales bacterium]|nr:alanyl-tRNA editing protein [Clostridiales bacterium]